MCTVCGHYYEFTTVYSTNVVVCTLISIHYTKVVHTNSIRDSGVHTNSVRGCGVHTNSIHGSGHKQYTY